MQKGNLKVTPNPVAVKASEKIAQVNRLVFCEHYDECLDHAIEKGWSAFSCGGCQAFAEAILSEEDILKEQVGCNSLIAAVMK